MAYYYQERIEYYLLLSAIFSKKSATGTVVHTFGIWGLEKLWSDFDNFWHIWQAIIFQSLHSILSMALNLYTYSANQRKMKSERIKNCDTREYRLL